MHPSLLPSRSSCPPIWTEAGIAYSPACPCALPQCMPPHLTQARRLQIAWPRSHQAAPLPPSRGCTASRTGPYHAASSAFPSAACSSTAASPRPCPHTTMPGAQAGWGVPSSVRFSGRSGGALSILSGACSTSAITTARGCLLPTYRRTCFLEARCVWGGWRC